MKVKVYPTSGCTRELRVEVEAEAVQIEVDGMYQRISREASLPGFRKGKAPLDLIRRQYKGTVKEEVLHEVLPRFFREAVVGEKIDPISQPRITEYNYEEGSPLRFVAQVEVKPAIELKGLKDLKLKRPSTEVVDADVEKALEEILEQAASFAPVEDRPVEREDLALVDFEGKLDGVTFEGGKADRYPLVVGRGNVVKDFEDALVGAKKDETRTFPVKFPPDYPQETLAGRTAEFTATVREIKKRVLPALDDAFAKDHLQCESVEDLKRKVREDLQSRKESESRSRVVEQLADQLITANPFDAPPSFIEHEHQRLVRQMVERLKSQGSDPGTWPEDKQKDFVAQFRGPAERNVRMSMIVDQVAETEGVECTPEDFDKHVESLSKALKQGADAVRKFLEHKDRRAEVEERIRYEKTVDKLIAGAKIEKA